MIDVVIEWFIQRYGNEFEFNSLGGECRISSARDVTVLWIGFYNDYLAVGCYDDYVYYSDPLFLDRLGEICDDRMRQLGRKS